MNLRIALRIQPSDCVAFTGAGGKSTAIFQLARDILSQQKNQEMSVLVTSTTHFHTSQIQLADFHFSDRNVNLLIEQFENLRGILLVTGPQEGDRTTGVTESTLSRLHDLCFDRKINLLIEADGSRMHPLKAPADHEPAIPSFTNLVVVVAGMQGLGLPLSEQVVHRSEIFSRITGLPIGRQITPDSVISLLSNTSGGMKGIPSRVRKVVLLNQADNQRSQSLAQKMAESLLSTFDSVVIASLAHSRVHATREPIAGIILSAGEAKRFGTPKQLLDWHGKPLVRHIAEIALDSKLAQVIVVTGSNHIAVEKAFSGLPIDYCRNRYWNRGQSSSIRVGLRSLKQGIGAVIFLLADQPYLSKEIINALCEKHAEELSPIVASYVHGRHVNPVLFDKSTFGDLSLITGDVGGRQLFSKFPVVSLPWNDTKLSIDIDQPEDYQRLINES